MVSFYDHFFFFLKTVQVFFTTTKNEAINMHMLLHSCYITLILSLTTQLLIKCITIYLVKTNSAFVFWVLWAPVSDSLITPNFQHWVLNT